MRKALNKADLQLVETARQAITGNYDADNYFHTVGAAVRCGSGKAYAGVNVYSLHGACGEQVAMGTAVTVGERVFETIVAVRGERGEEILPPCGNCRQMLLQYAPECQVILSDSQGLFKVAARELLPFAYEIVLE